jgi:hypothetical protein
MKNILVRPTLSILLTFFLSFNQACDQKTEEAIDDLKAKSEKPESIMAYYNAFTQKTDGKFALKSFNTHAGQDDPQSGSSIIDGFFFDKNGRTIVGGDVQIGSIKINPDLKNNNCYCSDYRNNQIGKSLYGTSIKISIDPTQNSSSLRASEDSIGTEIYIPNLIRITNPAKFVNTADQPYLALKVGSQIGWNVDEKNKKGIVIVLEYDPLALENEYLQKKGELINAEIKKAKAITVSDPEGIYTFTNEDLKDFPTNAYIKLTIGRANFTSMKNDEKSFSFFAYTTVVSSFQVKR